MILDGVTPDLAARTESLSHAAARTRGARTRARAWTEPVMTGK